MTGLSKVVAHVRSERQGAVEQALKSRGPTRWTVSPLPEPGASKVASRCKHVRFELIVPAIEALIFKAVIAHAAQTGDEVRDLVFSVPASGG